MSVMLQLRLFDAEEVAAPDPDERLRPRFVVSRRSVYDRLWTYRLVRRCGNEAQARMLAAELEARR